MCVPPNGFLKLSTPCGVQGHIQTMLGDTIVVSVAMFYGVEFLASSLTVFEFSVDLFLTAKAREHILSCDLTRGWAEVVEMDSYHSQGYEKRAKSETFRGDNRYNPGASTLLL